MVESLTTLQESIGHTFRQRDLLLEALSHPSYTAENETHVPDNQRLEFLGDAVIELIVTNRIFQHYPEMPEGDMTKLRAILTRRPTLAGFATSLCLGEHLRIGRGEEMAGGRTRPSNLCDAFEALIAAMYLDSSSLDAPQRLLNRLIDASVPQLDDQLIEDNPKGLLQELCQREFACKPTYTTLHVEGPEHQRNFTVQVSINETVYGTGEGGRRQTAEQQAATIALQRLKDEGHLA